MRKWIIESICTGIGTWLVSQLGPQFTPYAVLVGALIITWEGIRELAKTERGKRFLILIKDRLGNPMSYILAASVGLAFGTGYWWFIQRITQEQAPLVTAVSPPSVAPQKEPPAPVRESAKPSEPVPPLPEKAEPIPQAIPRKMSPPAQTDQARIEQIAKEKREKRIAKLCFHSPLEFTQTRLKNFQAPSTINYEYAKEILIKPFSFSGPTTVRIHVDGAVSWFHTTPRDKEFERFNGGLAGGDYVEVPVSSKILEEKQWSITLYGEKPFDVICVDKLPKKPDQPAILVQPKEKLADILIRKCPPATDPPDPVMERFPRDFIREWLGVIRTVSGMPKTELQTVMQVRPRLRDHISDDAHLAEAIFTLRCLESAGYIRIMETSDPLRGRIGVVVNNLKFEFVTEEKRNEFLEAL